MSETPRVVPLWVPLAPLAVSAAYLAIRWSEMPNTWISHWDRNGVPNGWSQRTIGGVFGPLLIALPVIGLLELIGLAIAWRGSAKPELARLAAATRSLVRLIGTAIALLIALAAAILPFGVPPAFPIATLFLALLGLALAIGLVPVVAATREAAAHAGLKGYRGFAYHNPDDPRLWVPKLIGIGWTLNFAHRLAWPIFAASVLVPIAIVTATLWLSAP
jgi:uncharacterized membrane protein